MVIALSKVFRYGNRIRYVGCNEKKVCCKPKNKALLSEVESMQADMEEIQSDLQEIASLSASVTRRLYSLDESISCLQDLVD